MKHKLHILLFLSFILFVLAACNPGNNVEQPGSAPTEEPTVAVPTEEAPAPTDEPEVSASVDDCAEPQAGTHQLIDAAQGFCFLYPDNYDVFQGDDGSLTLYVKSLLNTEAPIATIRAEAMNGRPIQEVIPDYPSDAELAAMSFLTIDLGQEMATVLDTLPGQDINRQVFAVHEDRVYVLMIARIGPEYGEVGEQAEALYETITSSFLFIDIEPEELLIAGPECPEASAGTTLYTNTKDGYCLLLPDGYAVDDSLTTDNGGSETAVYVDAIQNSAHPRLFITVEAANGHTLQTITTAKETELKEAFPGFDITWSFGYMLDGVAANQFERLPGQDLSRQLLMVANGRLYTLTFIPDDPEAGDAYAEMEILYELVLDSFSFLRNVAKPTPAPETPTSDPQPQPEADPFVLARQILEQADLSTQDDWQVALCEGEAAFLCINDGQQNVGYAELALYPLSGYQPDHPVLQAAAQLPSEASAYTADHYQLARQALISLAEENLENVTNDRAITFPEDTVTSLGMEPSQMGALPALSYGFVRTNADGEIQERYLTIAAFDQSFIYIFIITSDSANFSAFISDDALNAFTPAFYELAAKLPVPMAQS